jgi:heavy metal translocating P-type ATPase
MPEASASTPATNRPQAAIAVLAGLAIVCHLLLLLAPEVIILGRPLSQWPLLVALVGGGLPLVAGLLVKLVRLEFGSDLLAGLSIVTSLLLREYLAGTLVVLMLSGGEALEGLAVRSASSVLAALARRMPSVAHLQREGLVSDLPLERVAVGDLLVVFPHEICPADGTVVGGHGSMDESYLTGEPYVISKAPGSTVLSGAINGEVALTIRADRIPADSRHARIMAVMRASEQSRPRLRRLGDQLGALYTPLAVALAVAAWLVSTDPLRFLAVLVVATPCPLLIAIPVAIIGSISLSARRGIIIKDPAVLERVGTCRTAIFDKTGTLTCGEPELTDLLPGDGWTRLAVLELAAGLERYSKHPLAGAVLEAARQEGITLPAVSAVSEPPGEGLAGTVAGRRVQLTSRRKAQDLLPACLPEPGGLECVVVIDGAYAAMLRFRDRPRPDSAPFIRHLSQKHHIDRVLLLSGDRESEVRYLAERVGIGEVHAGQTPEQKLEIVRQETARGATLFVGDGINDAPALTAATVGVAFGTNSDVTAEAAGAVIMDSALERVDEFLHIGRHLRAIALQSAVGGMALSLAGMIVAAAGYLPPVAGAVVQEVIDVLAVLNALRVAVPPRSLTDY